ncbi:MULTISPECIES: hypothetical protein [unclassified Rhodococcus (in: high G+C Gram-positive bacteria)]|uniref:hypothetical protein n=1 Tax=unclassified Rhodococcus (in: high G+C Gram-positive bacteria) TaxID=192944 RepID=UPI00163AFE6C|nr:MULTISPECIES: hypothetical protein [unclassified Rhodococcus (in: high G+C Gram-positive bacteria)]MBC2637644.1 hypothetical protein [Rhodococcus sp. 3A]MBC2897612.1 hypothetical protein [Rhodococcus sp. 4CII]
MTSSPGPVCEMDGDHLGVGEFTNSRVEQPGEGDSLIPRGVEVAEFPQIHRRLLGPAGEIDLRPGVATAVE